MNDMKLKNKYKIALVGFRLSKGGAERQMANLSIYFDKIGIEVHNILVNNEVTYPHAGKVFKTRDLEFGFGLISRITRFWGMYQYIKNEKFDYIIDFRSRNKHLQELLIYRLIYKNIPVVYRVESYDLKPYFPKSNKFAQVIYSKAFKIITLTQKMENLVKSKYKLKNIFTINNAFNNQDINHFEKIELSNYIIAVGNMQNDYKQFDHLIKAFQKSNLKCKLYILGDGKLMPIYEQLVSDLNLDNQIIFLGYKDNVLDYMAKAKFYVMSSKNEGFPNVLLESLSLGVPVVSYDCDSGPSEIIINEYNGLLIENQSIEALASGMNRFLNDEKLYIFCKNNAKQSVEKFHMDNIGSKWVELLNLI